MKYIVKKGLVKRMKIVDNEDHDVIPISLILGETNKVTSEGENQDVFNHPTPITKTNTESVII